jgi:pyrroloquinoline quinone biosynthesis protein B
MRLSLVGMISVTLAFTCGCQSAPAPDGPVSTSPYLLVLGTAQDGGLPHVACSCTNCETARHDPTQRRLISSLAVVLPRSNKRILIDATPDIRPQLDQLSALDKLDKLDKNDEKPSGSANRAPVSAVFLTHAHLGHYTGLAFFGFEALHTKDLPVYCTSRMATYLRTNGPWSQLVDFGNIKLIELQPDQPVELEEGVTITPLAVAHRDEYADTLGFIISGPGKTVLYVPDTDAWTAWDPPLPDQLAGIDVALLDGTFYSPQEMPGRDVASIGHPLIEDSMDLLAPLVQAGDLAVRFTHLNHSNLALDPAGAARASIERRGFAVLDEGERIQLAE